MVHVRLGEPEAVLLREMMLSARVSNYPDHVNKGTYVSPPLQEKEEDCVMFPKTLLGRKASAFTSRLRQSYTSLTQALP